MTRPTTKKNKPAAQVAPTGDIVQYLPGNVYTKAFDWITRLDVPLSYRMVLCLLIRMCGRSGQKSCGRKFIAKKLNLSERTVTRAVLHWEQAGFFTVIRRYQRKRKTNLYIMHPDVIKTAWLEVERREALVKIVHFVKSDKAAACKDRHEHDTCMDPSSARTREEMLSASRVSDGNGTVEEQKALIGEIVEIRNQLHESNPERYQKIISLKAYTGKLATKSTEELKSELSQNRNVLENSKKPKSVTVATSAQSLMAQANEIERTTFTGSHEPWFVAWSSLEEQDRIGWRERTEAQLWNDSGWDEWCRQHPDPVEQELGRRRATRNLFRYEWEQLQQYQQDMEQPDAAAPAVDLPDERQDGELDAVEDFGRIVAAGPDITSVPDLPPVASQPNSNQVTPVDADPDNDQPPTGPKPKRRREHRREHHELPVSRPVASAATSQVSPQRDSLTKPELSETSTPARNILPFRRSVRSHDPDSRPPTRGPDDS